jgi:hypothetical protein
MQRRSLVLATAAGGPALAVCAGLGWNERARADGERLYDLAHAGTPVDSEV